METVDYLGFLYLEPCGCGMGGECDYHADRSFDDDHAPEEEAS